MKMNRIYTETDRLILERSDDRDIPEVQERKNSLVCIIREKESGQAAGCCGICDIDEEIPELFITVYEDYRNNGIGTESLNILMERFSEETGISGFKAQIQNDSKPCVRLMEKLKAVFTGLDDYSSGKTENSISEYRINRRLSERSDLTFREITEDDTEDFRKLYVSAFPSYPELEEKCDYVKYLGAYIHDNDKCGYMLMCGNTPAGFVLAIKKPSMTASEYVYVEAVGIRRDCQRGGLGTYMLERFFEQFPENTFFALETFHNKPAYEWYRKLGFFDDDNIRHLTRSKKLNEAREEIAKLKSQLKEELKGHDDLIEMLNSIIESRE